MIQLPRFFAHGKATDRPPPNCSGRGAAAGLRTRPSPSGSRPPRGSSFSTTAGCRWVGDAPGPVLLLLALTMPVVRDRLSLPSLPSVALTKLNCLLTLCKVMASRRWSSRRCQQRLCATTMAGLKKSRSSHRRRRSRRYKLLHPPQAAGRRGWPAPLALLQHENSSCTRAMPGETRTSSSKA